MSYVKQNFVDGQVLTADHLNHIEDGINALHESVVGGLSIFYTSVEIDYDELSIAVINLALTNIATHGRTVQVGDMVLSKNGTICKVDAVSAASVDLSPVMSMGVTMAQVNSAIDTAIGNAIGGSY